MTVEASERRSLGSLAFWLGVSFAAMAPWPVLGVVACNGWFDKSSEMLLMLGGLTGLILGPFLMIANAPEVIFGVAIGGVWIAGWLAPPTVLWLRRASSAPFVYALLLQSAFSLGQALLGTLIISGKAV